MPLWLTRQHLRSKNILQRRKAAQQLSQNPSSRAFRTLVEALKDTDAEVRRCAAVGLGKLDDDRRLEPLLNVLRDREPEVQKAAIESLKRFSGDKPIQALRPLLHNTDAAVRGHAAQALHLLGWRPADTEDEIWFLVARSQFTRVAALGSAAIPALEMVINSGPYSLCVGAIKALGTVRGQGAVRPLIAALKSEEASVCVAAVDALSGIGGQQIVQALQPMLKHKNGQVRLATVEGLGSLNATESAPAMLDLLNDSDWEVRRAAVENLGRFKDKEAVEPLTGVLTDDDADVREATALSLGRLSNRKAIGPLVKALKDSTSGVRRIAAAALSRIDEDWTSSPEAQTALEELKPGLENEDSDVRHFVGSILAGLAGSAVPREANRAVQPERGDEVWEERRQKLAVSLFLAILCDIDRDLRQAAAQALGQLGDDRAESGLMRALADVDSGVSETAERSLRVLAQMKKNADISHGRQ